MKVNQDVGGGEEKKIRAEHDLSRLKFQVKPADLLTTPLLN